MPRSDHRPSFNIESDADCDAVRAGIEYLSEDAMTHGNFGRRTFLGTAAAATIASRSAWSAAPSERLRVGVIGVRSRGHDLARIFAGLKDEVEVVALCDADTNQLAKPAASVAMIAGNQPRLEQDFRKLLDDKSIDAVAIATPDHWHALMAVMACQAGKDVYVEKPVSHNVVEGRRIVEAARKYNKIVQAGTQRRSTPHVIDAIAHVHSGKIGHVGMARAWIHQVRPKIAPGKESPIPEGVDFALWQGPATDRPFMPSRFHYDWHWFWNWGTGELGNNGIHGLDVARWGLGVEAPTAITSGGGKFLLDDDREVPDTQLVTYEFPKAVIAWEHRMWSKHGTEGSGFGIAFYGDQGTLLIDDKGWRVEDGEPASGKPTEGAIAHVKNFVDCVKSRKAPNAEVEIAHLSTRLCHLGNIAHRTGHKVRQFDPVTETFRDDPVANALLGREYGPRFEMPSTV